MKPLTYSILSIN